MLCALEILNDDRHVLQRKYNLRDCRVFAAFGANYQRGGLGIVIPRWKPMRESMPIIWSDLKIISVIQVL